MISKKTAPYAGTSVPAEQTQLQINKLLRDYGVQDFQWTTFWSQNKVSLRFALDTAEGRRILVDVTPPHFTSKHRNWDAKKGRTVVTEEPNWAQSMRCLLHWLKAKLEAVAWGLKSAEEEFLSDLIVRDQDGNEAKVGGLVMPAIEVGRLALPSPRKTADGTIEADARVVG